MIHTRSLWVLLGLALLIAAVLRMYRADELMIFSGDQGRDLMLMEQMIQTGEPLLLGPGSGVGQFNRGPAYYYLLAPALWLGNGAPFSALLFIIAADVAAVVMVFVVGRALLNPFAGIVAALLYACAQRPIQVARALSNPALLPFLMLVMVYALWQMIQGRERYLFVLVGAWLIAWQLHDQVWLLVIFFVAAYLFFRPRVHRRTILAALVLSGLLLSPFLYFESAHDASNIRAMLEYVRNSAINPSSEGGIGNALNRLVSTLELLSYDFSDPPALRVIWISAVLASGIALLARVRKETPGAQFLCMLMGLPFLYLIWPGPIYALNVAIVLPIPCLIVGYGATLLAREQRTWQYVCLGVVVTLCGVNLVWLLQMLHTREPIGNSYATVRELTEYIRTRVGDEAFAFDYVTKRNNGDLAKPYYYMFQKGGMRLTSQGTAMHVWLYDPAGQSQKQDGLALRDVRVIVYASPVIRSNNILANNWKLQAHIGSASRDEGTQEMALHTQTVSDATNAVQRMELDANRTYLLQFECRNQLSRGEQRVYVQALDRDKNVLRIFPNGRGYICPPTNEWTSGSILLETPADTARGAIYLRNRGEGTVWFRNVTLHHAELVPLN